MPQAGTEHRKLTAIMFTDMVGYSALAERNEELALELLEEHRRLLRFFFEKLKQPIAAPSHMAISVVTLPTARPMSDKVAFI